MNGHFITFEGGEGAGKSTQIKLLGQRLAQKGIVIRETREPGGAPEAEEIGGRRAAIAAAIGQAGSDDIVLLAGKGHEQGQIIGDRVLPFDDVTVARECAG